MEELIQRAIEAMRETSSAYRREHAATGSEDIPADILVQAVFDCLRHGDRPNGRVVVVGQVDHPACVANE
jgi:hypothetical protein